MSGRVTKSNERMAEIGFEDCIHDAEDTRFIHNCKRMDTAKIQEGGILTLFYKFET